MLIISLGKRQKNLPRFEGDLPKWGSCFASFTKSQSDEIFVAPDRLVRGKIGRQQ